MEFKGTKGEWIIKNPTLKIENKINILDEYGDHICVVDYINGETEANALLISKAPEMLEILNEMNEKYKNDGHLLNFSAGKIELLIKEATEL